MRAAYPRYIHQRYCKMAASTTFSERYKLTGIKTTDKELGRGSYATVLELEYMGLKCAGKKIHEPLLKTPKGDASYTVRRFEEECRLLSQVRHPNIVQFLGVFFQHGMLVPILVMEYLPTNLTSCIDQYGILPKEISYSILHDVALGLHYLHNQTPPIVHRDLSSNNVLLTSNMTAKISDLGVAKIVNLNPLEVSSIMPQTPGTVVFLPPEVIKSNPAHYDASMDVFSYGVLMLHVFSGRWPELQVRPVCTYPGRPIPGSEAEQRSVSLKGVASDHPLINLIRRCINNLSRIRPPMSEIVKRLAGVTSQSPSLISNKLEMLKRIEACGEEKKTFRQTLQQERSSRAAGQFGKEIQATKRNDSSIPEMKKPLVGIRPNVATKQQVRHTFFSLSPLCPSSHTFNVNDILTM